MNFSNILHEIEQTDPEVYERVSPRRKLLNGFFKSGKRLSLAALPVALGGLLSKAYGGSIDKKILNVLQFALKLEHLENRFYQTGVATNGLIPAKDKINLIRDHEAAHVKFLQGVISSAGATPVAEGTYDFTAGGTFPNVFRDYKEFLTVAQAFEDTGVGAYKGQAEKLEDDDNIMRAALQIHSMEARHSAHIRFIRMTNKFAAVKPWIVGDDNSKGTPFEPIYKRESDHRQVVININGIGGYDTGNAGTTAFDEPLYKKEVEAIVKPFIVA